MGYPCMCAEDYMKTKWVGLLAAAAFLVGTLLLLGRPQPAPALLADEHLTDQLTCADGCNTLNELCCLEGERRQ